MDELSAFDVELRERTARLQMALTALCLAVEGSETYEEGFRALRHVNDQGFLIVALAKSGEISAGEYLDRMDDLCDHVLVEVERLDTRSRR